jgi:hypothetical protein
VPFALLQLGQTEKGTQSSVRGMGYVPHPDSGSASRRPWRASYFYRLSPQQIVAVAPQFEDRLLEI